MGLMRACGRGGLSKLCEWEEWFCEAVRCANSFKMFYEQRRIYE